MNSSDQCVELIHIRPADAFPITGATSTHDGRATSTRHGAVGLVQRIEYEVMTMSFPRLSLPARCIAVAVSVVSCTACLTLTEEPFAEKVQDDRVAGVWVKESKTWEEGPAILSIARSETGYVGWHGREQEPPKPLIRFHLSRLANGIWAQIEVPSEQCQKFVPFGAASRCYLTARVSGLPDRLVLSHPRPAHWVHRSLAGDIAADHALVGAGGKGPTLWSFYLGSPMESVARVLGDDTLPAEAFEPLVEYAREW